MLATIPKGLSQSEVTERLNSGRFNKAVGDSQRSIISIIFKNVVDLPNAVIFAAVAFLLIYGQTQDALLISGIMFMNTLISIFQEVQARNYLRSIQVLKKELITVIREGKEQQIEPELVVLDDIIKVEAGKYLYVDGQLLSGESLLIDESILTGESDYVKKEDGNQLMSGSFVINGIGYYQATKIGAESFVNKITTEARKYINYLSPLQHNIIQIVKILIYLSFATIALMFLVNLSNPRLDRIEVVKAIISIVTSMVPQGIILTITLALTIGVIKMARKKIIVQRTNSIETMAEINILCMDKTGTLTANKLELMDFIQLDQDLPKDLVKQLAAVFCANSLEKNKTLLAIADKFPFDNNSEVQINKQIPFNSQIKLSAMDFNFQGKRFLMVLGPLESVAQKIEIAQVAKLSDLDKKYAAMGRRNLFFVIKPIKGNADKDEIDNTDIKYKPLAFISLEDQLRPNAAEIINNFLNQGIKPVIISGDGPGTLEALMKKLKIVSLNNIITGKELAIKDTPKEFEEAVIAHDIFARVTPEQKVQIIKAFQKIYHQVAMIGDGVNDALALKTSNLGVALGSGAQVTKNIADVILLDDNLISLSQVMNEGRIILYNSLRSAQLLLVKNIYAVMVLSFALILSLPFPFNPRSLFILAFMVGNPPVLMVLADQRQPAQRLKFLRELYRFLFLGGVLAGLIGLGILSLFNNPNIEPTQTILISFFVLTGMVNYLLVINNTYRITGISLKNWRTYLVVLLIPLYFLFLSVPAIREFLSLQALTSDHWLFIFGCSGIYVLLFDLGNRILAAFNNKHNNTNTH